MHKIGKSSLAATSLSLLLLTACGSDSTSSDTTSYSGTFVVPQSLQVNSLRVMIGGGLSTFSSNCPNVPDGYEPMANATVTIETSSGAALAQTTTTDSCGTFTLEVPESEETLVDSVISATLAGYKTLQANANNFQQTGSDSTPPVASTIPSSASYLISAIQKASTNQLSFSVTDTSTNNAVIQLSKSAFEVYVNDQPLAISTLNSADQLNVASSNVVTLDASGSMSMLISGDDGDVDVHSNSGYYDRFRVTAKAAHQFVTEKADVDEVMVIPFSTTVDVIKNSWLDSAVSLTDSQGASVNYDYADDGFTTDAAKLHLAMDIYNPYSGLWLDQSALDGKDAARTDTITSAGVAYPWSGLTELEDAINQSIDEVKVRNNSIKRVFVLTDGQSVFSDRDAVVASANNNNVVVHAIAVSAQADEANLKVIAADTGGSYHKIIDEQNIAGIYSSLQTTIKYAYVATLASPLQAGDTIKLVLTVNGETVERLVTVQ